MRGTSINQYVIRVRDRDELRQHLMAAGVGTEIYYPVPLHLQQCFAYFEAPQGRLPAVGARGGQKRWRCPSIPELTEAQLQYVVDSVADFYRR